jgi:tRNA(fMet)-specific endonuclease VapC
VSLRYLLDTSVVSAPVAKVPHPGLLRRLESHGDECAIAAPVWHELTFGCARLPRGARRTALEAYLEEVVRAAFTILPYDEAAAAWHGRERARLESLGEPAPFVDGQIAAIAQVNGLILVTLNTKDFARFHALPLEDWSKGKPRA